jgi:iron(III) transport system substrate-binding protein
MSSANFRIRRFTYLIVSCFLPILFSGCSAKPKGPHLTIYTSSYKEVLEIYKPELKKAFPELEIDWYQAGSEAVAARVLAEQRGDGVKADLLMTSDLFFYQELKKAGQLQPFSAANASKLPSGYIDDQKMFAINRFPVMVIAVNTRKISSKDRPAGFHDLVDPKFKDKITMPSPLESGTTLASALYFFNSFGEDYFKGLRKNNILAAGGNGAALARVQSGEKPVAIVLMENVLQAREKGNDFIEYIVPQEGALAIPSPLAIFKNSQNVEWANKVFDWFLSDAAQPVLVKGWIYSPFANAPTPNGATPWSQLKMQPWDLKTFEKWGDERQKIKDLFQNLVLK